MRTPAVLLIAVCLAPAIARAQQPPTPGVTRLLVQDPFEGIKHQFSFMLSGGFDLDVVGNVVNGALGSRGDAQLAIRQSMPWPDVYVAVPKRTEFTAGFAFTQKKEVVVRLSRARYAAEPVDAGNYVDLAGESALLIAASPYEETSWEIGLRHHMIMTRRAKQWVNLMYGHRLIEPLQADFLLQSREEPVGTFRLYDRSTAKTFAMEMGLSIERGRAGAFALVGARFVRRMTRNDEDLAAWNLEIVNNTGVRFYMPLQFGVLFRL